MRKKCKVVMLSTEKASKILPNMTVLDKAAYPHKLYYIGGYWNPDTHIPQHLYILSYEEIKEGDLDNELKTGVIFISNNKIINTLTNYRIKTIGSYYKIIATTNPELNNCSKDCTNYITESCRDKCSLISKISQDFIEAYIKEYNAGNPITEVMIKYEVYHPQLSDPSQSIYKLKLRSDNTIYISRIKEKMYSRDEIKEILKELIKEFYNPNLGHLYSSNNKYKSFEEWFNKNYPK